MVSPRRQQKRFSLDKSSSGKPLLFRQQVTANLNSREPGFFRRVQEIAQLNQKKVPNPIEFSLEMVRLRIKKNITLKSRRDALLQDFSKIATRVRKAKLDAEFAEQQKDDVSRHQATIQLAQTQRELEQFLKQFGW